jgi:iron complex outermembrane receptor protein
LPRRSRRRLGHRARRGRRPRPGQRPLPTHSILSSVDILGGDKVQDKNVMNSWELIGQMPGIQLTETRMGAESGKATFRAFNGEGYINGIKVLIDGIPSNVNSGNQRFIDMIFPLDIEYIEVVRGPTTRATACTTSAATSIS